MGFYGLGHNSPSLSYVIGVLLGDGCVYRMRNGKPHPHTGIPSLPSWRVELQVADEPFAAAFADALGRAVKRPENRHVKVMPAKVGRRDGYRPIYRVAVASRGFGDWWHEQGRRQEALWPYVERQPAAFLRGLYDSEGNLCRGVVRIFSQEPETLALAQGCLATLGLSGAVRVFRPAGTRVVLPGNAGAVETKHDLLTLSPLPSRAFLETVGSSISRKRA